MYSYYLRRIEIFACDYRRVLFGFIERQETSRVEAVPT